MSKAVNISRASTGTARRRGIATADLYRPIRLILIFVIPALLLYGVFFLFPMARAIYLSFCRGAASSTKFTFVGLENYTRLLRDENFHGALMHNLAFLVIAGPITICLALLLAVGLTSIRSGRAFYRVSFLFPNVMPVVATALLWSFIFNPSFGLVNAILRKAGLDQFTHAWLGEPRYALLVLMLVHVWGAAGFYVMLFYAGILRIPADYTDAARIDGASAWQEFWHVTLPLLGDLLKTAIIYIIINSLNVFALVFLVTEGNPDRHVDVALTYLYEQAFKNGNFGYACTIGVTQLALLLLLATVVGRFFRRETIEL
ncbi:MAG: carbohydrate ABC transporter permease [Candidatus Sumerlaeaceae bacterium]